MRLALEVPRRTRNSDGEQAAGPGTLTGFVEAVTGADRDVGTDLPRARCAQALSRAAGFF